MKTAMFTLVIGLGMLVAGEAFGQQACFPTCRAGYLCHDGECVSRCNPACDAGEVCTSEGTCMARQGLVPPPPAMSARDEVDGGSGWAGGAAILGYTSAGVMAVLGTTAVVINEQEISIPLGGAALLDVIVTAPIVAAGGASARRGTGATGSRALRILSWIGYGLSIANGAALIGMGAAGEDVSPTQSIPTVALGAFSLVGFAYDAMLSGQEARHLERARSGASLAPSLKLETSPRHGTVATVGVGGVF